MIRAYRVVGPLPSASVPRKRFLLSTRIIFNTYIADAAPELHTHGRAATEEQTQKSHLADQKSTPIRLWRFAGGTPSVCVGAEDVGTADSLESSDAEIKEKGFGEASRAMSDHDHVVHELFLASKLAAKGCCSVATCWDGWLAECWTARQGRFGVARRNVRPLSRWYRSVFPCWQSQLRRDIAWIPLSDWALALCHSIRLPDAVNEDFPHSLSQCERDAQVETRRCW